MFFRLSSLELGLLLFAIVLGSTVLGIIVGRRLRAHADSLREPFGVLQAALLGLVGLILAFGLTMAVGRYDSRRAALVEQANTIGTTYLRAQTLREPIRSRALDDLVRYTDVTLRLSNAFPGARTHGPRSPKARASSGRSGARQARRSQPRPPTVRRSSTSRR